MTSPMFLVIAPLVLSFVFFSLRRWPQFVGPAAAFAAWIMAAIVLGFDLGSEASKATWTLYGQSLVLTEHVQLLISGAYVLLGFILLLSAFYAQGGIFVALSLAVLSPLSAALMIELFAFGVVLLLLAAGGLAVLIQGNRAGSTLASLRFLSLAALAMPLMLSARWLTDSSEFRLLDAVTLLNAVALLLLATSFPFQIWVAPIVRESSSLAPSVVFGVGQLLVVVFFLNFLVDQPFIFGSAQFRGVVSISAAATLILSAFLTVTARSFGQLVGYLLLLSIGAVMSVIGSGDASTVEITLSLLVLRVVGLILTGAGLAIIRARAHTVAGGANQFMANRGLAWQIPLGAGLFVFGCLSLAGLPLTPGFAGTWPAVLAVGRQSSLLGAILVLSIAGGAFGVLRRLMPLLARTDESGREHGTILETKREQMISGAILIAAVMLVFFPGLILTFSGDLASLF